MPTIEQSAHWRRAASDPRRVLTRLVALLRGQCGFLQQSVWEGTLLTTELHSRRKTFCRQNDQLRNRPVSTKRTHQRDDQTRNVAYSFTNDCQTAIFHTIKVGRGDHVGISLRFWHQKSRIPELSYGVVCVIHMFSDLCWTPTCDRQTDEQLDGETDTWWQHILR